MTDLVLDTHTSLWHLANDTPLSRTELKAIREAVSRQNRCFVPSICLVEATYLVEKHRISVASLRQLELSLEDPESNLVIAPLDFLVTRAVNRIPRYEVPDLPDRVIAATALAFGFPLITRDGKIRASGIEMIW